MSWSRSQAACRLTIAAKNTGTFFGLFCRPTPRVALRSAVQLYEVENATLRNDVDAWPFQRIRGQACVDFS